MNYAIRKVGMVWQVEETFGQKRILVKDIVTENEARVGACLAEALAQAPKSSSIGSVAILT